MRDGRTKDRIFEAAERLFVERGFAAASLRAVTGEAGVNLAAVHYHFGSKEALLRAVLRRRLAPMNQERLKRLDQLEAAVGEGVPTVEAVLEAFLAPALQHEAPVAEEGVRLRRLLGRLYSEPRHLVLPILREEFRELGRRYLAALGRALPELPPEEIRWRFHFVVGAMIHIAAGHSEMPEAPELAVASVAPRDTLRRMVAFLGAGMRTRVPGGSGVEEGPA